MEAIVPAKVDPVQELPHDVVRQMRALSHELSNSLEVILQAHYLLGQTSLSAESQNWLAVIGKAITEAARINRDMREILRSQSQPTLEIESEKPQITTIRKAT